MKKFLSLLISLMLISSTAFADGNINALKTIFENSAGIISAESNLKMSVKLNKPLEILNSIPLPEDIDIDFKMLVESIISGNTNMSCTYFMAKDYKKLLLKAEISNDLPIEFSNEFKLGAYSKFTMWIEYDFTNSSNPVYKIIFKLPFYKKYLGIDMSKYFAENPDEQPIIDKEKISEINGVILKTISDNATVSKNGSEFTINFNDNGAKKYILDILEYSKEFALSAVQDEDMKDMYDEMLESVKYAFEKIKILGERGMFIKIRTNASGFIKEQHTEINICLNVFDVLEAFSKSTEGLEREKAYVDLTLETDADFAKHNKIKDLNIPETTEENSDVLELPHDSYSYDSNYNYFSMNGVPVFENDNIYYPIDVIAQKCGFEITDSDEKLIIDTKTTLGTFGFDFKSGKIIDNREEADEAAFPAPVIKKDNTIYCSPEFLELFNVNIYVSGYSIEKNTCKMNGSFAKPMEFSEDTENDFNSDVNMHIPSRLNYIVYVEGLPYFDNGVYYIPMYELANELLDMNCEFAFESGYIEAYTDENNSLNYQKMSARVGDYFIMLNDSAIEMEYPVTENDGIIQIPVTVLERLGFDFNFSTNYYSGSCSTRYTMNIPNPEYIQEKNGYKAYVPEYFYFSLLSDKPLYIQDDVAYMPAYEFIEPLFDGTFEFDEGYMEYVADEENDLKIEKISIKVGDSFVMMNNEQIELEAPVLNINDVIRIPVSFSKELGLEITGMGFDANGGLECRFRIINPEYVPDEYEK